MTIVLIVLMVLVAFALGVVWGGAFYQRHRHKK